MERIGIAADIDHFAEMSASLYGEVKAAEQAAYAVVGHEFNLGSPKQLQEVLFTELGLPKTKKIKTGYTTDSDALTNLLASTGHPVLEHIMHHRDVSKLKSFVDILTPGDRRRRPHPHHVQPDGRRDRPPLLDRPEPAEHPDPAPRSAAASARASSSARATRRC